MFENHPNCSPKGTDDGLPFSAIRQFAKTTIIHYSYILLSNQHSLLALWQVGTATNVGMLQRLRRFGCGS
jgi:hypothetical protein